jgi:hypothetical protein
MKTIEADATSSGSRDAVWALLEDVSQWSKWGAWTESGVEGGAAHGPGAVRVLVKWPFRMRELVTEWAPGERMGYEVLGGMNIKGYRATVSLEDAPGGGTVVRWRSAYVSADPLTALLVRFAVRDACKRLAKAASQA